MRTMHALFYVNVLTSLVRPLPLISLLPAPPTAPQSSPPILPTTLFLSQLASTIGIMMRKALVLKSRTTFFEMKPPKA